MSWASRRRTAYLSGTILFFAIVIGGPVAHWYFTIPPSCYDGIQNQGETDIDRGGPCHLLDPHTISPSAVLWTRSFHVRDGSYNAMAYIDNPNEEAGVRSIHYRFGLYDSKNLLIAERTGTTFILPSGVTPVFESAIDTGKRIVTHTYFEFTDVPQWERVKSVSSFLPISEKSVSNADTFPHLTATVKNIDVGRYDNVLFDAVIFDPAGNAFAASQTIVPSIHAGETTQLTFTWPDPFPATVGRIDVFTLVAPRANVGK